MTRPAPEWLQTMIDRLAPLVPGEAIVMTEPSSTKMLRHHLVPEELATGRGYMCKKNKFGAGIVITRES